MILPTCMNCKTEMVCDKNDVAVIHFMNNDKKQGIDAMRMGDAWECPKCGARIVINLGDQIVGIFDEEHIEKILKSDYVEVKR